MLFYINIIHSLYCQLCRFGVQLQNQDEDEIEECRTKNTIKMKLKTLIDRLNGENEKFENTLILDEERIANC
jgi:hypothetical protein